MGPEHLSPGAKARANWLPYKLLASSRIGPRNIIIIYLHCQSAYVAQRNRLLCTKLGTGTVQFLIKRFSFLGLEGQYWMLVAAGLIAIFIFFVWKTSRQN
jgi:hypothetical protein